MGIPLERHDFLRHEPVDQWRSSGHHSTRTLDAGTQGGGLPVTDRDRRRPADAGHAC